MNNNDAPMSEIVTDRKKQLMLFIVMAMAFFLDGLDGTIVTIALENIGTAFNMELSDASWIIIIYFMVMAGLLLVFGKIADKGAIKKVLIAGFILFSIGSMICALCEFWPITWVLLAARAVQGIGSAMLASTGVMLAVKFVPLEHRNMALSLTVLGSTVGAAFGPALGGILLEYCSWASIFWINVPIGFLCAIFAILAIPKDDKFDNSPFDYVGSALLIVMMFVAIFTLETIPSGEIDVLTSILLALFAVLMLELFIVRELRISYPVLKIRMFNDPRFTCSAIAFLIMNVCYMGLLYLVPFMLRIVMGLNDLMSGLMLLLPAAVTIILCVPAGKLSDKNGTRMLSIIGSMILVVTSIMMIFINQDTMWLVIASLILSGGIWGIAGSSIGPRIVENANECDKAPASSLITFIVYFGSALGAALFTVIFNIGSGTAGQQISDLNADTFLNGWVAMAVVSAILSMIAVIISITIKSRKELTNSSS